MTRSRKPYTTPCYRIRGSGPSTSRPIPTTAWSPCRASWTTSWRVKNHLKVRPAAYVSDEQIISTVKAGLKRNPFLNRYDIDVSAYNGKVYLYGKVDSEFDKKEAEDVAFRVNGVIEVADDLSVRKQSSWKSDWEIEQGVDDQLYWDTDVDATKVDVSVHDGVVTLTGDVDNWHEYMAAAKDAFLGGARELRNDLHMEHAPRS